MSSYSIQVILSTIAMLNPMPVDMDRQEVLCLSENIFWEARSETLRDQILVANTTLYSADRRGSTVCEEVYRPYRYSWTLGEGKDINGYLAEYPAEKKAWEQAVEIAVLKLAGEDLGVKIKATHFYSPQTLKKQKVDLPKWRLSMVEVSRTHNMVFMRDH